VSQHGVTFRYRMLPRNSDSKRDGGVFPEGSESVMIVFNAGHKVSIQSGISAGVLATN
jgi:hypothetical protein